jgi:hypothetical protein
MPLNQVNYGVPTVQVSTPDPVNSLATMAAVTFAVTSVPAGKILRGSSRTPLPAGTYKVWATLMGYDPQGGYAMTASTATMTTAVTNTSGNGLLCRIAATNFGATNIITAVSVALWIQVGSANPQLCDFAYVNPSLDFSFLIQYLPSSQAPYTTASVLTGAAADPLLGSIRTPQASLLGTAYETTGGVQFNHQREGFTASPDNSRNFPVTTSRGTDVSFRILNPLLQDSEQVQGGDYLSYTDTDTNSTVIEQGASDLFTTLANMRGNGAILVTYPANNAGRVLRKLVLGCQTVNNDTFTETFQKDAQTELQFTLSSACYDKLLLGMQTTIARID